jgi:hypothetical protein
MKFRGFNNQQSEEVLGKCGNRLSGSSENLLAASPRAELEDYL